MKFEAINRKFTEKVAEYMAQGWHINSATMSGSQGEISKIDLTNGTDILRILLTNEVGHARESRERSYFFEFVALTVGLAQADNYAIPDTSDTSRTLWNNRLDTLFREEFYKIGGTHSGWYGTKSDAMEQQDKHRERYDAAWVPDRALLGEAAKDIVLPYVRRQPGWKTAKRSEIESVVKNQIERGDGSQYAVHTVKARGRVSVLH